MRAALEHITGALYVTDDDAALARAARSTVPEGTRPALIVRPSTRDEVVAIVCAVAAQGGTVYPVSGGRNWGYSDACAPEDGAVLVDLSRMSRIVEVNASLAYAVIEPGVTQGALAAHLRAHDVPLRMDATGAGPDASICGNVLERGIGYGAYGDRGAHVGALEVVLADGSVLETGVAAYGGARATHVRDAAIGPSLDGLFTQSGWGIVTRLTIWLQPEPRHTSYLFLELREPRSIGRLLAALRDLRLHGVLPGVVHVYNEMRLLGGVMRRPVMADDGTPLARDVAMEAGYGALTERLLARHRLPAWTGSAVITGASRAEVAAKRRAIKRRLSRLGVRTTVVSDSVVATGARLRAMLPSWRLFDPFRATWDRMMLGVRLLRGESSVQSLYGAGWRARTSDASGARDPIESGAGITWVAPLLPADAECANEVNEIARTVLHAHGFEHQVTFTLVTERAATAVVSICFDRADAIECARAAACHDALVRAFLDRGYVPYRGGHRAREMARAAAPVYWNALDRVRIAIDPDGVISRGR
ncbi:MAG: FAD-dependent oxidoreductase [Gemmatimonadaceae bacterium]